MANRHSGGRILDTSADFAVDDTRGPPTSGAVVLPTWVKSPVKKDVKPPVKDLDEHRLAQRQKQIDYGKNTLGYQRYLQLVPKHKRQKGDPQTPDMYINNSKRAFEGQIKVWRRQLHKYDQDGDEDAGPAAVLSYAERARLAAANREGDVAVSAVASSPTNSSRSRGSLDGYLPPAMASDASGRKRPFKRAFDQLAAENPQPSKLLTSPAGPRPGAPQSAPPATTDAGPAPSTGRCMDPPGPAPSNAAARAGSNLGSASGAPKAPATAPPAAPRGAGAPAAATTTMGSPPGSAKKRRAAGGEDMFREWDEEEYAGLEQWDDEEVDVQL
ncbi:hypothetical protein HYH02_007324 [Chlamydomonas schloesseri]|uniref:Histone RNA hairpin-binding protein RNA-binding domain-containing protein n=1 Tax=Chlamydomonas schloesseri TaxID=2026947 RepID=A0A835WHX8_9CHLO|nr:hypothetical protein HYH02_007324 [Chlamydomonas schloesseri]|eukprot:KAG2447868.1 hypothetical protein HYH02_007324 [Chlamydomonas schloesseri]